MLRLIYFAAIVSAFTLYLSTAGLLAAQQDTALGCGNDSECAFLDDSALCETDSDCAAFCPPPSDDDECDGGPQS